MHRMYGCETGCCGHAIEIDGEELAGSFDFEHPRPGWGASQIKETDLEFAKRFIKARCGDDHVKDLDWENSVVVDD
jgi:hypothetical protein